MKRTDKIEEQIRKFEVETNAEKDKAVLDSLLTAQTQGKCGTSGFMWRIAAVAAGFIVVSAVWWFTDGSKDEISRPAGGRETAAVRHQSLSELTSVMSLNKAFYSGGMEAVEKQFNEVEKRVKLGLKEHITINQLLCDSDDCKEI